MIDRDTVIDLVALVDTEFEQLKVGTYNGFDIYERFALYVEAKVRAEEREACAKLMSTLTCMGDAKECFEVAATYIRARGQK